MTTEKAIEMIDEYLLEPNSIAKDWIECLRLCKQALLDKEALINGQETLQKHLAEKNAEIEELVCHNKKLLKDIHYYHDSKIDSIKRAKAEAIKKFWDKLKEKAHYEDYNCTDYVLSIFVEDGDNLVKEMLGTKTDTSVSLVDGHIESDFDSKAFWEDTH